MSKKKPKIKFSGIKPENGILKAQIPDNDTFKIMGPKINFNHRASSVIETGLTINIDSGYKLCFALVPELANRGMIATNAPGNFTEGKVFANVLNVGREIVEIKTGDPLMIVWFEEILDLEWSSE